MYFCLHKSVYKNLVQIFTSNQNSMVRKYVIINSRGYARLLASLITFFLASSYQDTNLLILLEAFVEDW